MQPFSVTCETCGARLKVRDERLIGEIHGCPKCASMVLIASPTAVTDAPSPAPLATAIPSDTLPPQPATAQSLAPTDFAGEIDSLLQTAATSETAQQGADLTEADSPVAATPPAAVAAAASGGMLIWGTAIAAMVIAVGLLGATWWSLRGAPEVVAQAASEAPAVTTPAEPAAGPSAPIETLEPEPETEPPPTTQTTQKPPVGTPADLLPELPEVPSVADTANTETLHSPESNETGVEVVASSPDVSSAPEIPMLIDPLGIDPMNLDLLLVPNDDLPAAAADSHDESHPSEEVAAVLPPGPDLPPDDRPQRRFEPGAAVAGPSFAETFTEGGLQTRLANRIPSIRWVSTPLDVALAELSQLAGLPVQVSPGDLQMAPIESRHPVTLMQQNVSVQAIAEALAKSVRLEAVVQDNQIFLVKPQSGEVREVSYRINDLVIGGDQGALVEILQEFALDAAGRAEIVPDDTGIVIRQSTAAQYDVLVFTERLRKARGMTTRSKYPTGLIHETPRLAQLESRLSRRTTFAFIDWTPLADVFSYWQESSGIGMVVDWQSLSLAERRPMSTMAGSVDRATWREALTTCLEPLGLDWVPIDGQAIWITTRQAARDFTWVEFYPADSLTELPSRHRTADGLREELSERCDLDSVAGARLRDDPAGKLVLVRGNRHIHQTIASLQGSSPVPLP